MVGSVPRSLQHPQMLLHCPQAAVALEGSGLGTGLPGDRDIIYVEVVCGGQCQELSQLEMFVDDKKQPKAQAQWRNHSNGILMMGTEEHKD